MASATDTQPPSTDSSTSSPPAPILTLPKVIIRPYHIADAPAAAHNGNDPRISQYMTNMFPNPYELHHAEFFINTIALVTTRRTTTSAPTPDSGSGPNPTPGSGSGPTTTPAPAAAAAAAVADGSAAFLHYALCRRDDGSYMGGIGLKPGGDVEARTWEVGYWLGAEHWGRGYMTEAVAGFSAWAFRTFPEAAVLRLEASVFEGNLASQHILRRVGYREEGVRRKAVWKDGRRLDLHYYGMLREECPGLAEEGS